jgi:hypothetical protein
VRLANILVLLLLAGQVYAQEQSANLHLRVGFDRNADGDIEITVELENRGSAAVSFPLQFAPWAINAMEITVRRVNASAEVVPQGFMIADYPRRSVRLAPGERRAGRFPLAAVVKDSRSKLQETDLVVFWYWQPRLIEPAIADKPLHGSIHVPRK